MKKKHTHREDASSSMGGVKIEMKASRTGGMEDIKKLRLNKRLVDFRKSCHKRQQQQQWQQAQPSSRKIKTDHKMTHLTYICSFVGLCECVCVWVLKIFRFSSCGHVCLRVCVDEFKFGWSFFSLCLALSRKCCKIFGLNACKCRRPIQKGSEMKTTHSPGI